MPAGPRSSTEQPLLGENEQQRPESPRPRRMEGSHQSHDGIQKLLIAEQEAQATVTAARQAKTARLKQAREEAEAEISAYRQHLEEQYAERIAQQGTSSGEVYDRMETDTLAKVEQVKQAAGKKSSEVVAMLKNFVTTVKLETVKA